MQTLAVLEVDCALDVVSQDILSPIVQLLDHDPVLAPEIRLLRTAPRRVLHSVRRPALQIVPHLACQVVLRLVRHSDLLARHLVHLPSHNMMPKTVE